MAQDESKGADDDPLSDPEEQRHFRSVLDSFRQYRPAAHYNTTHVRRQNFYSLPSGQWQLLSEPPFCLLNLFDKVDDCIDANSDIAEAILAHGLVAFPSIVSSPETHEGSSDVQSVPTWHDTATKLDVEKARSTIHQLYRDWSVEGEIERRVVYEPIFHDLAAAVGDKQAERSNFKVLVPGAGLGRLVFELCRVGYDVEGNEISYHQLLASSFVLNHTTKTNEWAVYPWALSFSNLLSRADQLQKVMVPDIHPGSKLLPGSMNMTMGDFCMVYKQAEYANTFDAVVTLFFIDTAPNFIDYIQTVKTCLKPGGSWINIGPLLWHFESGKSDAVEHAQADQSGSTRKPCTPRSVLDGPSIGRAGSFELSNDEVVQLVEMGGFQLEMHDTHGIESGYMQNPRSMLQNAYKPVHWLARKV